jgi:hypothetical protein
VAATSEKECRVHRLTEDERVLGWRIERLAGSGFSGGVLLALAVRFDVELRDAEALVRRGCPAETAARILL